MKRAESSTDDSPGSDAEQGDGSLRGGPTGIGHVFRHEHLGVASTETELPATPAVLTVSLVLVAASAAGFLRHRCSALVRQYSESAAYAVSPAHRRELVLDFSRRLPICTPRRALFESYTRILVTEKQLSVHVLLDLRMMRELLRLCERAASSAFIAVARRLCGGDAAGGNGDALLRLRFVAERALPERAAPLLAPLRVYFAKGSYAASEREMVERCYVSGRVVGMNAEQLEDVLRIQQ